MRLEQNNGHICVDGEHVNAAIPSTVIARIQRQVFLFGYEHMVGIERKGVSDPTYTSVFKSQFYHRGEDLDSQLRQYRLFLAQITSLDNEQAKILLRREELRRLPREIHLRLSFAARHECYKTVAIDSKVEEFYESLGYRESTADKMRAHGIKLQRFIAERYSYEEACEVLKDKTSDIGGFPIEAIRRLPELFGFRYFHQIVELLDIKDLVQRNFALSNPKVLHRIGDNEKSEPLSHWKCGDLRRAKSFLNAGGSVEDLLQGKLRTELEDDDDDSDSDSDEEDVDDVDDEKDSDEDGAGSDSENEKHDATLPVAELEAEVAYIRVKSQSLFRRTGQFGKKLKRPYAQTAKNIAAAQVLRGYLHIINEGWRHYHADVQDQYFCRDTDDETPKEV